MIEIKNKRMILFREDRLIGAAHDVDTSQKKFILDAMQGECDLTKMIAWIKIDPQFPGESPYDQLLKREVVGDKIILTWQLTAKNLQRAGEISAQVIFASPTYFLEDELDNILGGSLILPSPVEGKSAPVWQSYPETFVIEESIDGTVAYKETTKNVLVAAVAEALESSENASEAAENAQTAAQNANEAAQSAQAAVQSANEAVGVSESLQETARSMLADLESKQETIQRDYDEMQAVSQEVRENLEVCCECAELVDSMTHQTYNHMEAAQRSSEKAKENARSVLDILKKARDFRIIYKKTLTAEDTDCYSFEITEDQDGKPFSLSEFIIFAHIPSMPNAKSFYVQIWIQPENMMENGVRKYGVLTQFAGIDRNTSYYHRIECANKGRWRADLMRGGAWNQNGDTLYHTGAVCSTSRFTDGKSATAIIFFPTSNDVNPFPEGTEIEIWGVDAIEEAE